MKNKLVILSIFLVVAVAISTGFIKCSVEKEICGKEVELTLIRIEPTWRSGLGEVFKLIWQDTDGTEVTVFRADTTGYRIGNKRWNIDRLWQ